MKLEVHNRCSDFASYRAARVKSLFNVETGCNFDLIAELPLEGMDWNVGLVVGPSGSGKTSLGEKIFGEAAVYQSGNWPLRSPIIDAIAPKADFDSVAAALSAVGLGSVPSWLRPYHVLSNGEKFRASLARIICEQPKQIVIDEFTSVVDRQIAKIGAMAFAKAWRRTGGQAVMLSCHYDIVEWMEPDWVFDTSTGRFAGRGLWRRPRFELEIRETDGSWWPLFEPHHYLKLPRMIAATYYVGFVEGQPVCHVATSPRFEIGTGAMRACRLVVMPEWQGAGVGVRFLNAVCQRMFEGLNRWGRKCPTYFHTSHPGLAAALRRQSCWRQVSAVLYGGNKAKSAASLRKSAERMGKKDAGLSGYGGHFRAVQGFKFTGEVACA
jgi:GNAT superfamily N-acetyltransferase